VNVGRRPGESGFEFLGTIDEVRIYNRTLTQAEVQSDMNTPASGGPAPDTIAPSAPGNLNATAASASQINLTWTASTDNVAVTGYLLERCQGAGCGNFAQIATPASTTFSDTNLTGGTSYSYRVRATDAAANLSTYSNVATAITTAAQAQMYFIHPDHLNTPRMIANQAGTTVWRNDNTEPFGNSVPNGDPGNTGVAFDFPLRFPGQYADRETGVTYNSARDYDPGVGRYVEADPIGLFGGSNLYAYARANPLSLTDPRGQFAICWVTLTGRVCAGTPDSAGGKSSLGGGASPDSTGSPELDEALGKSGAGSSLSSNTSSSSSTSNSACCPACSPYAAGTIGYLGPHNDDHYSKYHGMNLNPHLNLWVVNQNKSDCKCYWNKNWPDAAPPPPADNWVDLNGGFPALTP
jgi:RHS repeat-associated protein